MLARTCYKTVLSRLAMFPTVLLRPRQVGKTTLAEAIAADRDSVYLDLENPFDEKRFAVHLQPVLAAHKGEHAAHGAQEILDPGNQRAFQFPLTVCLAEFQKIEGVGVFQRQFGLVAKLGRQRTIEVGLTQQRFFIALVFDLMDKHIPGPAESAGHADVELAFQRIFALIHNDKVV